MTQSWGRSLPSNGQEAVKRASITYPLTYPLSSSYQGLPMISIGGYIERLLEAGFKPEDFT
jgi:hypothetical protein